MPGKRKYLRHRAENFLKGVKDAIAGFSPRKKSKRVPDVEEDADDSDKENLAKGSTVPSDISVDPPCENDDVFLASELATFQIPAASFAWQTARPAAPTAAPEHSYHEYSLNPPPPPKSRRAATVEEVPDEDDISFFARLDDFNYSNDSLDSLASDEDSPPDPEEAAFESARNADIPAQDAYANVYNAYIAPGKLRESPPVLGAASAAKDLAEMLRGKKRGENSAGYKDPGLDPFFRKRLECLRTFLNQYTDSRSKTYGHWGAYALQTAVGLGRGRYCVRTMCQMARQFIHDRTVLPVNPESACQRGLEEPDNITPERVKAYLDRPEVREEYGITAGISLRTARRYLRALGYRYGMPTKGQYVDGHERPDVVCERDHKYIPKLKKLSERMRFYDRDGHPVFGPYHNGRRVVVWYHDGLFSTPTTASVPGDGHSLMVSDYVSIDFGWSPTSLDGRRTARRFLRPGKNRDGYVTAEDVKEQAEEMMDILDEVYPGFEHVFVYDNATTHKKRPDGSLSARQMPKFPSLKNNWLVTVNLTDSNGKPVFTTGGQLEKTKIPMHGAEFDGKPQDLFGNRALKFVDAYSMGLNGRQAAWASRKYHGHRVLPMSILEELDNANIV
ncbi:hypothetical protein FB45DRAFT_1105780 [Roridomyces roridus]|uniref:Transposase n=1 Tax=Roridomyces roridus TaxID=1738132 RepID=A0AAD7BCH5_9AGAR|nr:hypothetical protein FB45DRAFT_1105780 [Roridomyces roridus]